MALHSTLSGAELHENKRISSAAPADAGKVETPSAVAGVGELRLLTILEINSLLTTASAGQAVVVSATNNGQFEVRALTAADFAGTKAEFDAACSNGNFLFATDTTTTDIGEGTNLYYTEVRVKADVAEKVAACTAEATADATDETTAIALVNSLKAKYNTLLAALAA